MTPCQELGYSVGDKFRVREGSQWFPEGCIVVLKFDDWSTQPLFQQITGVKNNDGVWWEYLSYIEPLIIIEENE